MQNIFLRFTTRNHLKYFIICLVIFILVSATVIATRSESKIRDFKFSNVQNKALADYDSNIQRLEAELQKEREKRDSLLVGFILGFGIEKQEFHKFREVYQTDGVHFIEFTEEELKARNQQQTPAQK